jgi:hypothetical protein
MQLSFALVYLELDHMGCCLLRFLAFFFFFWRCKPKEAGCAWMMNQPLGKQKTNVLCLREAD